MPQRVLFLCTHNSARSQMAEGLLRHLGAGRFEAASAGSVATSIRAEALQVMSEEGFDLAGQESKTLDRYLYEPFDLVVTVCDRARDSCPTFPSAGAREHWSIADPAAVEGSVEERLSAFRAARDAIRERIVEEILPRAEGQAAPRGRDEHYRKLERMYLAAPTNAYYQPAIEIAEGEARVVIEVRPEFSHAAGAVHGSVYFKALDDACFFAVSSLVEDHFVLTSQFNIHLTKPVTGGALTAVGRVKHATRSSFLAGGELRNDAGELLALGEGTFIRSRSALRAEMGYA